MPIHTISRKIKNTWLFFLNQGLSTDLNKEEIRVTRLLNFFSLAAIPYSFCFAIINLIQQRWVLAIINLILLSGSLYILFNKTNKKYKQGRVFLILLIFVLFSATAILFENGGEYFLILNLLATTLLFRKMWQILLFTTLNVISLITIKYIQNITITENVVGPGRVYFNMGLTMAFIIIVIYYFKSENNKYHLEIEVKNNQLEEQKKKLLNQTKILEQKTRQLEVLNHTKEKLFSVVAHDMKSPIASLRGSLELYNKEIISKEDFSILTQHLTIQVDNLYHNLDNLLQWSASQLNGIKFKPQNFPLKQIAQETISLLEETAIQKKIKINQNIPEDIFLFADPNHTQLILRNLISNAIKFTNCNGVIEVNAETENQFVRISVKDSGVGMNQDTINFLLGNNGIESKRGTNNEMGMGLGLALCKEFIQKNNGHIYISSKTNEGTTISFTIPQTIKNPVINRA